MVHTGDAGHGPWSEGRDRLVFLGAGWQHGGAALQVLVRADGYAPTIATFLGAQREKLSRGEATVTLRRGQNVQRGWTALEHCSSGGSSGADFDAPAARTFVVFVVPDAVLIGPDGRILWRGHGFGGADGKDLRSRIEDALK